MLTMWGAHAHHLAQVLLGGALCQIALLLQLQFRPFKIDLVNRMQTLALFCLVGIAALSAAEATLATDADTTHWSKESARTESLSHLSDLPRVCPMSGAQLPMPCLILVYSTFAGLAALPPAIALALFKYPVIKAKCFATLWPNAPFLRCLSPPINSFVCFCAVLLTGSVIVGAFLGMLAVVFSANAFAVAAMVVVLAAVVGCAAPVAARVRRYRRRRRDDDDAAAAAAAAAAGDWEISSSSSSSNTLYHPMLSHPPA